MAGAFAMVVPSAIIGCRHPISRDRAPPLALIYNRSGESCCAIVHPGSFPCPDAGLRLLTICNTHFLQE
jgi:hypothetical protein